MRDAIHGTYSARTKRKAWVNNHRPHHSLAPVINISQQLEASCPDAGGHDLR
jgi:hypothetical protein